MRLDLEVTSYQRALMGDAARHTFDTRGGTVGRSRSADWVLTDPNRFVSSQHLEIRWSDGAFQVTDTSTNGVFINGRSIPLGRGASWRLSDGDTLTLGDFQIQAWISDTAGAGAPVAGAPGAGTPLDRSAMAGLAVDAARLPDDNPPPVPPTTDFARTVVPTVAPAAPAPPAPPVPPPTAPTSASIPDLGAPPPKTPYQSIPAPAPATPASATPASATPGPISLDDIDSLLAPAPGGPKPPPKPPVDPAPDLKAMDLDDLIGPMPTSPASAPSPHSLTSGLPPITQPAPVTPAPSMTPAASDKPAPVGNGSSSFPSPSAPPGIDDLDALLDLSAQLDQPATPPAAATKTPSPVPTPPSDPAPPPAPAPMPLAPVPSPIPTSPIVGTAAPVPPPGPAPETKTDAQSAAPSDPKPEGDSGPVNPLPANTADDSVLARLAPSRIEETVPRTEASPVAHKAALWDEYKKMYGWLVDGQSASDKRS